MSPAARPPLQDPHDLDAVDRTLVRLLRADGRTTNADLARRAGIPESTCAGRVRALRERGVVRGIHAEVDLPALGLPLEAMVAVRFSGHSRADIDGFRAQVQRVPGVVAAYHVTGGTDFLVHVAAADPHELRDVVLDRLTVLPGVAHAETSIVYERLPGLALLDRPVVG